MASTTSGAVVVTGAASGIGFALAQAYAARGHRIVLADVNAESLQDARERIADTGVDAVAQVVDLRDPASIDTLVEGVRSQGEIAAVCLNAGVTSTGNTVWETAPEVFDSVLDVNLRGLVNCVRGFVPLLVKQERSADLVITASMAGMTASGWSGAYSASKAGAVAIAKALRVELGALAPQVRLALLNPGMVKTNLIRSSAQTLPGNAGMADDMIQVGHQALNDAGSDPAEVAESTLRALDEGRFWVLPPDNDMFTGILAEEQAELGSAVRG